MGPTGNVYPRQPRSPRRKLSRWAQAWGRGTVCRLLDEWAPQPVRPHLHPSLPKGGGQSAPWPPPHPLFLSSPCPPLRPLARRWTSRRPPGRASPGPSPLTHLRVPWAQAQKESYRQEKKRATKQLLSALTDPSVVIMADSLKVSACVFQHWPGSRRRPPPGTVQGHQPLGRRCGMLAAANCMCPQAALTNDHRLVAYDNRR